LGRVLGRPTVFPLPAFAARLAFGEMADALLLASTRVEPKRLLATQYVFRYPELDGALRHLLGKA
jgi:NAD dependent epimerase/dehydratase family enzyme